MEKGLLKFITCGSVDDGKSTLIGHMLYDAKLLYTDQQQALLLDSQVGSREGMLDYSLLLDGLMAEREQGITIDVAYRYFTTDQRSFIVADTPGHEEYTRNMAVGASFADLAVILVDATQGILTQTRRHARICALMGIRYFVFAVNKMDLIHYDFYRFEKIERELRQLALGLELENVEIIPVSATEGDNVTKLSHRMTWYKQPHYCGKSLLEYLEQVDIHEKNKEAGFVMPVQRVCRPNHTFRGFQGQIESGSIHTEDEITVLPSGEKAKVRSILVTDRETDRALKGQPVTVQLDREVDVSRGCVLEKNSGLKVSTMFVAMLLWMDDDLLVAGRNFQIKIGTKLLPATVMNIKYKIDVNSGEHIPVDQIYKNEIAYCDVILSEKCVLDKFTGHRTLGSFVLIDRVTNMTSACGVIQHSLRRADNLTWQETDITRKYRAGKLEQNPVTIWFTGLSGAGKSTLANELEKRLNLMGRYTMLLDGDNVRMGLNRDLGFKEKDRVENIRRVAEVAKLMNDAGLVVLASFISPYHVDRESAREIIGRENFIEVYVSTSLEECKRRDVKKLYQRAENGEISNFTGVNSPYEKPLHPDIAVDTAGQTVEECAEAILEVVRERIAYR